MYNALLHRLLFTFIQNYDDAVGADDADVFKKKKKKNAAFVADCL